MTVLAGRDSRGQANLAEPGHYPTMEWAPVIATAVGAVVGLGSALVIEASRIRRQDRLSRVTSRADAYVDFLAVVARCHDAIRETAFAEVSPADADSAIRRTFQASGIYASYYRVGIVAPAAVVAAVHSSFLELRALRDVLISGAGTESPEFLASLQSCANSIRALIAAIRVDLGTGHVVLPPDL